MKRSDYIFQPPYFQIQQAKRLGGTFLSASKILFHPCTSASESLSAPKRETSCVDPCVHESFMHFFLFPFSFSSQSSVLELVRLFNLRDIGR